MFFIVLFSPWLALFVLLAINGRWLLTRIMSNHPRLLVDPYTDKRPKTAFAAMSGVRVFDASSNHVISWGEFIGSNEAIEVLGDDVLRSKWHQRQKLKKAFFIYSVFSFLAIIGYIIFKVLNYAQ